MRRRIILVVLATTSLVVVAFAVPLGALVRSVAHDRAIANAQRDVASLSPTLAVDGVTPDMVAAAIDTTETGAADRMAVWLPDGTLLGDGARADEASVELARQGRSFSRERDGGQQAGHKGRQPEQNALEMASHGRCFRSSWERCRST